MSPEPRETLIERYLHEKIPLSAAMGVRVGTASREHVRLWAPFAPNVNDNDTVFGGSTAAIATLAAWTLLHLRLEEAGLRVQLVIQRSRMEYEQPVPGDFEAVCRFSDEFAWERFRTTLTRKGRARIGLAAAVAFQGQRAAAFEGDFVALERR